MKNKKWIVLASLLLALGVQGGVAIGNETKPEEKDVSEKYTKNMLLDGAVSERNAESKNVAYSVEYYFENGDGRFVLDNKLSYEKLGEEGDVVSADAVENENYAIVSELSTVSKTLESTNNILRVYYGLKKCDIDVKYYFENVGGEYVEDESKSYTVTVSAGKMVRANVIFPQNYELDYSLSTLEAEAEDGAELSVYYSLKSYPYTVEHYFEENGEYKIDESKTQTLYAKLGESVNVEPQSIEAYTFNEYISKAGLVIKEKNNVLRLYYTENSSDVRDFTVNIYYEKGNADGFDKGETKSIEGTTLQSLLASNLGAKEHFVFSEYNVNGSVLDLYYRLERLDLTVEYFFEENGNWVKKEALSKNYSVKYGSDFISPVHDIYKNRINEEKSTLRIDRVLSSSVIAVYYGQEKYEVQICDVCTLSSPFMDSYNEVIGNNFTAKLYKESEEFDLMYKDGAFVASLTEGEYSLEISSPAFADKYQSIICVNEGEISVECVSQFSELAINHGGSTTLVYDNDANVWANLGQDASSFSYITATASDSVAISLTVTARHEKYVANSYWRDSEHAVGVALVNAQNTDSTIFIGLYQNGVKVKANGKSSIIKRDYFKSFTQGGSQTSNSTLSVARLDNGEIYIYRDGMYVGWITSDGWCNGIQFSTDWYGYVGERSYVGSMTEAPNDYKEFVFSDIGYTYSSGIVNGFSGAKYYFKESDGFSITEKTLHRQAIETVNATSLDGKIVKAVLVNGEHYMDATVTGKDVALTLSVNPTKHVSKTNNVSLIYEDERYTAEVSGRIRISDWLSLAESITVKLVSEQGITYVCSPNAQGIYKINVPKGKYTVFATCGKYVSEKQTAEINDNTSISLIVEELDFAKYSYSGQDDVVWVHEDDNSMTLNGRINQQKVVDLFAQSYSSNFAYSIDMIQAWKNPESRYNTSDDVTGVLLRHSSGKYLGFYVESSASRIRVVSNAGDWSTRVNVPVKADLYRKTDETTHNIAVVKNNGAIYFLIDGVVQFVLDGTKITDGSGLEITNYESFDYKGSTTIELLNETVTEILNGGSVTAGVGSGFNNAVVGTVDKTGFRNAIVTQNQEIISSILITSYGITVIKDENVTVTLISNGYDKINGEISQNSPLRIVVEAKSGYALDYVRINGVDVYLKSYSKVYAIGFDLITKDTIIKVGSKEEEIVNIVGQLTGSADFDKATVSYYADSAVYTTTPNTDGSFSIKAIGEEGIVQVIFADGKVRNIQVAINENIDVGEVSPVTSAWSHKDFSVEAAMDVVASDDSKYVFAIGTSERSSDKKGHFYVYSVEEDRVVASLEDNLGNCRQIAYENGYCYVTARDDGMWVIDVTDYCEETVDHADAKPKIICHYDSVEMATGIIVHDSTVFLANRVYGVEVVDVSNPYEPEFITNIQTGEVQSLDVNNGLLFAGIWGEQKVLVVDISDLANAKTVYSIPLDGRGDGVFVEDGILYAATGHHARGDSSTTSSPAWGMGNGLEVFKVDKNGYDKIFGIKFDKGHEDGLDMWEAVKAGNYVYVTNTFNGTYIYDVTDIYNPIQVEHLHCDRTNAVANNATGVAIIDGAMFVTGGRNGLFRYNNPDIKAPTPNAVRRGKLTKCGKTDAKINALGITDYQIVKTEGQVRSVVVTDKYLLTANGNEGICVYDKKDNTLLNTIHTGYIVKELQIDGNYLYSAEDAGGIAIYDLDAIPNKGVAPLYRYDATTLGKTDNVKLVQTIKCNTAVEGHPLSVNQYDISKSVTAVAISEIRIADYNGKKYMLMHAGGSWAYIADVTDISNVKVVYKCMINSGLMYARNFVQNVVEDKYFVLSANSVGFVYLNIDGSGIARNSENTDYLYHNAWRTSPTAVRLGVIGNGITTVNVNGEYKVMFTTGHGYRILDREVQSIYDNPIYGNVVGGWPVVFGNILVVSNRVGGILSIYDISDITNPSQIAYYETNASPDLATRDGNTLYVPIGNYGFMIINLD